MSTSLSFIGVHLYKTYIEKVMVVMMQNSSKSDGPKYPVQTLEKTLKIIEILFNEGQSKGIGISELSRKLGIGKSSIHRILDTLAAYDYIERCSGGSGYRLGWKLFEIGSAVPQQHDLNSFDTEILRDLCNKYNETVNIGIRVDDNVVTISKVEPSTKLMANIQVGGREPLHCTAMGKCLISELRENELAEIFGEGDLERYTPNTITSVKDLKIQLEKIREQGYSIDDQEFCMGLSCIAMPIRNYKNEIVAAISISGLASRFSFSKIIEIKEDLDKAAQKLTTYLGGKNASESNLPNK